MEWTVTAPAQGLEGHVGSYRLITTARHAVHDMLRANTGQLRLFLDGSGTVGQRAERREKGWPATLSGPFMQAHKIVLAGPCRVFCVTLMPPAWAGLVQSSAGELRGQSCDALPIMGSTLEDLRHRMQACHSLAAIARLADDFLTPLLVPLPQSHAVALQAISAWLRHDLWPDVNDLYDRLALSPRQIERIANRYWGAPPRTLARTYAALRTAARIVAQDCLPNDALSFYADTSHLIREVRRVTGQTPDSS